MSLESDLLEKARQWRRLAEQATDPAKKGVLTNLAHEYEATAALHGGKSATDARPPSLGGQEIAAPELSSASKLPPEMNEGDLATLRDGLVEDLRAIALPIVTRNSSGSAALMALAQVAGDVIAAVATSPEHLEESLRIFARLTRD